LRKAGTIISTKVKAGRAGKWRAALFALLAATTGVVALSTTDAQALTKKHFRKPASTVGKSVKVNVDADQIVIDQQTNLVTATGSVEIVYGPWKLNATKVVYNLKSKVLDATGAVYFKEKNGNYSYSDRLKFDTKLRDVFADHVQAMLTNNTKVTALFAHRTEGRYTVYTKAHYTACIHCLTANGEPVWEIVSEKSVHDDTEKTLAHYNPRLKIAGATVAGLPYLKLPAPGVKRMTGFLTPNFRYTDYTGFGVITPYFWNLAPNYDLTLTPFVSWKQGAAADLEWRHRLESGTYNIRAYGAYQLNPQDNAFDNSTLRGAVKSSGKFRLNSNWNWGWDGQAESDRAFLGRYGYGSPSIAYNDIYLTGLWDQTYINASAYNFLAMTPSVDPANMPNAFPFLEAEHTLQHPVLGGELTWSLNSYALQRDQSSTPYTNVYHGTAQSRVTAQALWKSEQISDLGTVLTTSARLRSDVFVSRNVPDPALAATAGELKSAQVDVLPSLGLDLRLPLIASNAMGQSIITPVVQVFTATSEKRDREIGNEDSIAQNLDHTNIFLEDRFTGLDRYEGGVRANAGLTYNLFASNGAFVRASIGESFHLSGTNSFGDRSGLQDARSDLVGAFTVSPWEGISLKYEGRLHNDLSAVNRQIASVGLSFDRFSGNVGYLFIDSEPSQGRKFTEEFIAADGRYLVSPGWYLTGNMKYDLQDNFFRQQGVGIQYECECMDASLSYSANKSKVSGLTDHRVMFTFSLATIGGTSVATRF
jgi:LPS-assembly protein